MGGLRQDKDGWDQGAATTTGDFFMTKAVAATRSTQESPAKELFEWCIAYRMTKFQPGQPWVYLCNNRDTSDQMTGIQVEQESSRSSKMLGLRYKWVQAGAIQVDVRYSFHTCSKLMKIEAKITNLHPESDGQMEAPAFMVMVNANQNRDPPGAAEGSGTFNTVDTIQGQSTLGNIYSSVCSSGADDLDATGLSLCLSSMSANSYAYRGLDDGPRKWSGSDLQQSQRGRTPRCRFGADHRLQHNCPAGQVHRLGHVRAKSATEPADGRPRHVPWRGDPERCEGAH